MNSERRGLSAIEVVVVFVLIVILMSLILPALQKAKSRGRTHCLNNFRNVALAMMGESATQQRLTPQATYLTEQNSGRHTVIPARSWVVDLLPHLDYQSAYDQWDFSLAWDSPGNSEIGHVYLDMLICPQDESAYQVPGSMSLLLNCGLSDSAWKVEVGSPVSQVPSGHHPSAESFDWNGNGQLRDSVDVAVSRLYLANWPAFVSSDNTDATESERHFFGQQHDGSSNTILLVESTDVAGGATKRSWANPELQRNAFLAPVDSGAFPSSGKRTETIIRGKTPFVDEGFRVGGNHSGVFVVALFDGSVMTVSQDIDESVFLRMLTPSATLATEGNNLPEDPLTATEF